MAVQTDATDHFLIWTQIQVLIVLNADNFDAFVFVDLTREMARGARDSSAARLMAAEFFTPQAEMWGSFVGATMFVVMTGEASLYRRILGVKPMRGMARGAAQLFPMRCGLHRLTRHFWSHG